MITLGDNSDVISDGGLSDEFKKWQGCHSTYPTMNIRRILFLLVILGLVFLFKPKATMSEAQRVWSQRDWILYVLVTAVGLYLLYGLYGLYIQRGSLW